MSVSSRFGAEGQKPAMIPLKEKGHRGGASPNSFAGHALTPQQNDGIIIPNFFPNCNVKSPSERIFGGSDKTRANSVLLFYILSEKERGRPPKEDGPAAL